MFGIDDANAVSVLPTPATAGTAGYFSGGNPATNTAATKVRADWLNMVQDELLNIVAAKPGLTPSKTTRNQVLTAIQYLISLNTGGRLFLAGATNFYVDVALGNDSNNGTAAGTGRAWQTLNHAVNTIQSNYDQLGFTATINMADGTYTPLTIGLADLTGPLTIRSSSGTATACIISGSANAFYFIGRAAFPVTVQNVQVQSSAGSGIYGDVGSYINLTGLRIGACAIAGIISANQSLINLTGGVTYAGNCGYGVQTSGQGAFNANSQLVTLTGPPVFANDFVYATNISYQGWAGATFSGTGTGPRYRVIQNSVVDTGSGSTTFFVAGNAADGTPTASGGQYL